MKTPIKNIISGSLLVAGTTIGAGMLGIPLLTSKSGFLPASVITVLVWLFMLCTGFLFLEATLWMHEGANILSMSRRFIGVKGRLLAGAVFIFLYYSLMIAYFSAGAPLLFLFLQKTLGLTLSSWGSNGLFALMFGLLVAFGLKWVDRVNYILMIAMLLAYAFLIGGGIEEIDYSRLESVHWGAAIFSAPVLFSSFGFHNVVPSLTTYFKKNAKVMRLSILLGTLTALLVYLLWQWLIIGAIPKETVEKTLLEGRPITEALQSLTGRPFLKTIGRFFAFFALVTSMLGVAFSMVDFLGDGLKMARTGGSRLLLCFFTFFPPFLCSSLNPEIFVLAISFAGGFGEAFLNGILPAWLVWVGRYRDKLKKESQLPGGRVALVVILLAAAFVIGLELFFLIKGRH